VTFPLSEYEGNYGERDALDQFDRAAYERDTEAEEREHLELERLDRLRRDWPIPTGKKVA
jgi:hypothetical protein